MFKNNSNELNVSETLIAPDNFLTGEKIRTPRGNFSLTDMTAEQMKSVGYGFHHNSDDGRFHIMGNGTRAFAIKNESFEKEISRKISNDLER